MYCRCISYSNNGTSFSIAICIYTYLITLLGVIEQHLYNKHHPSPSEKKNKPTPTPQQKNHPPNLRWPTNRRHIPPHPKKALLPWPCSSTSWPWTRACGTTVAPSRHRRRRRWCAAWPGKCSGALKRRHQRLRGALGGQLEGLGMVELHMISDVISYDFLKWRLFKRISWVWRQKNTNIKMVGEATLQI